MTYPARFSITNVTSCTACKTPIFLLRFLLHTKFVWGTGTPCFPSSPRLVYTRIVCAPGCPLAPGVSRTFLMKLFVLKNSFFIAWIKFVQFHVDTLVIISLLWYYYDYYNYCFFTIVNIVILILITVRLILIIVTASFRTKKIKF